VTADEQPVTPPCLQFSINANVHHLKLGVYVTAGHRVYAFTVPLLTGVGQYGTGVTRCCWIGTCSVRIIVIAVDIVGMRTVAKGAIAVGGFVHRF